MLNRIGVDVGDPRSVISGEIAVEGREILLRPGRSTAHPRCAGGGHDGDVEPVAARLGLDRERQQWGDGHGNRDSGTEDGCPAWIRTTIAGRRVRSLTVRRRGSALVRRIGGGIERPRKRVNAGPKSLDDLPNALKL